MSKLLTMTIVVIGTLLILNLIGYKPLITGLAFKAIGNGTATSNGTLIDYNDTSGNRFANFENYSIWSKLIAILTLVGVAGTLVASFFGRSAPIEYVIAPIVTLFGGALLVDLLWMLGMFWSYGMPYNALGTILIVPIGVGYVLSLIEWWRFGY